jgi:hypothetical protein
MILTARDRESRNNGRVHSTKADGVFLVGEINCFLWGGKIRPLQANEINANVRPSHGL